MDFDAVNRDTAMKKTLGRRRIPIRMIEKKQSRKVSFSKRRAGLLKKASELSALCGSEIAVIVFSESGKAFSFGHPSAESVIRRYVNSPNSGAQFACNGIRKFGEDEQVVQWENRIGMLGLKELQLYANWLHKVRDAVSLKASSMASTSDRNRVAESDHGNQNPSSDGLIVQDSSFDDVNDQGNQMSSTDDLNVQDTWYNDMNYQGNHKSSSDELHLYANWLQEVHDSVSVNASSTSDQNRVAESDHGNLNSSSDDDLNVQDSCFDDVNYDQGNQKLSTDDLNVQDSWLNDLNYDQGNQKSSSDDLNVKDSWYDDVNWEDIETYYMARSPVISPKPLAAESSYEYMDFGDGTMEDSEVPLLPCSSSSCFEVDTEFERSLCGIKWEKDEDGFDLFAYHAGFTE